MLRSRRRHAATLGECQLQDMPLSSRKGDNRNFSRCLSGRHERGELAKRAALAIVYCFSSEATWAQENPIPARASATTAQVSALSSIELWLAIAIILFGFIVLCMQYNLLRRATNTEPEDILRLFTVTIVIIGTLSLIAIGYSSQQIAPALGLFGTILGYLLGKSDERIRGRQHRTDENAGSQSAKTGESE